MIIRLLRDWGVYQSGRVLDAFDGVAETLIARGFARQVGREEPVAEPRKLDVREIPVGVAPSQTAKRRPGRPRRNAEPVR